MVHLGSSAIFFQAYTSSDGFGKLIFLGLFLLSFISWAVIIKKTYLLRNVRKLHEMMQGKIRKSSTEILQMDLKTDLLHSKWGATSPYINLYQAFKAKTLQILEKNTYFHGVDNPVFLSHSDVQIIEADVEAIILTESKRLEKHLFVLSTAAALAPLLGILGTVWGMLISLSQMQLGGAASNNIVLSGLATALATTVLGLVIAIPALIAYNYLRTTHKSIMAEMWDVKNSLLCIIELQYRKVETT